MWIRRNGANFPNQMFSCFTSSLKYVRRYAREGNWTNRNVVSQEEKVQIHCVTNWLVCVGMSRTGKRSCNRNHENHFELWTSIWEFVDFSTSVSVAKEGKTSQPEKTGEMVISRAVKRTTWNRCSRYANGTQQISKKKPKQYSFEARKIIINHFDLKPVKLWNQNVVKVLFSILWLLIATLLLALAF